MTMQFCKWPIKLTFAWPFCQNNFFSLYCTLFIHLKSGQKAKLGILNTLLTSRGHKRFNLRWLPILKWTLDYIQTMKSFMLLSQSAQTFLFLRPSSSTMMVYSTAQVQGNVRTRLKRVLTASETRLACVWDSGRTRLGRVPETRLTSSLLCVTLDLSCTVGWWQKFS